VVRVACPAHRGAGRLSAVLAGPQRPATAIGLPLLELVDLALRLRRRLAGELITTNTIENGFSVLKRGMNGDYQHCGDAHLHRYLAEITFRHNRRSALGVSDKERVTAFMAGIEGKRLTYRRTDEAAHA
jgi:hypothetical protein